MIALVLLGLLGLAGCASTVPAPAAEADTPRPPVARAAQRDPAAEAYFHYTAAQLHAQAGRLNVFFLSGAQIDGRGNINLMAIGPYEKPKVRLPGGAGSAILAYVVERVVLFKTEHTARGLVAAVDTVTAPGYTPELSSWQRPGRITCLVTPKCVFNFSPPAQPHLASLHPGVSLEEVRAATGFRFEAPAGLPETPALDAPTRSLLYGPVKEKLAQAYPHFAARLRLS